MAQSRLTVRTLAMAMVALVLACVHAARGDGRGSSIASFASGTGAKSSAGRSGSIATIHGDPWKAPSDRQANTGKQASTGKLPPQPIANVSGKPRPKGARTGPHEAPICIVRRPGEAAPIVPLPQLEDKPIAAALPQAPKPKVVPLGRNAFALSPNMASR